jgi:hypothetical protein
MQCNAVRIMAGNALPITERLADEYMWRVNPRRVDEWRVGREGRMEFSGVDFLMAAYAGRHFGFI